MKLHKNFEAHITKPKKTTIGNNHSRTKFSSMNKSKKRSYKKYKGQGKQMANQRDDTGKLEVSVRVLGNELIGLKMVVDDFKMKWLVYGVVTIVALGWAGSTFGPALFDMVGDNVQ